MFYTNYSVKHITSVWEVICYILDDTGTYHEFVLQ